jgi:FHA domain
MPTPVTLKVFRGEELVRSERFARDIIKIGRLSSAHLCLEDDRVSRIHSVIEVAPDGHISIIDMGSAEGTFVNGKRVSKGPLRAGDEIKLGGLRIVFDTLETNGVVPQINRALDVPGASMTPVPSPVTVNGAGKNGVNGHLTPAPYVNGSAAEVLRAVTPVPRAEVVLSAGSAAVAARAVPLPAPAPAQAPRPRRPAMALARSIDDEPAEVGAPDLGVEVRVLWGDTLLDAATFVTPKAPVLVGEGPRCHFRMTGPALPGDAFPILRHEAGDYRFLFLRAMNGAVVEKGVSRSLAELVQARSATPDDATEGAFSVSVPRAGVVYADLGSGLRVEARYKRPPRAAVVPWWEKLDYRYLNLLLVLLFIQGGFIVAAKTTTRDVDLVQDDLAKGQQRMAKFVIKPLEAQPKRNPYLEKLKADLKKEQPGEMAERHKGEEGQMGRKDAPRTNGRSAPRAIDPNAKELVKNSGLLAAIGNAKGMGGLSTVFGQGGLGGDLKGAIGNMFGPVVGDSYGVGGLGLKGKGTGGGGGGDTIGIGGVGTKGRGGGLGGYGTGVGGLGSKRDRDIAIASGDTRVLGAIDPELVRKVIRDHADQVRYCYEQQLTLNPKLAGKVAIKWQINADGSASATIIDPGNPIDSAGLRTVADCIMSRIKTWEFPKPKGGGMAIVTYPWILRSSGSTSTG